MAKKTKKAYWWEARSTYGIKPNWDNGEDLLDAGMQYFQWCDENPLYKTELKTVAGGQGAGSEVEYHDVPVRRYRTLTGLCFYCGTTPDKWSAMKENPKLRKTCITLEAAIRDEKLGGAASGFFNSMIVSRDIGLREQVDTVSVNATIPSDDVDDLVSDLEEIRNRLSQGTLSVEKEDQPKVEKPTS